MDKQVQLLLAQITYLRHQRGQCFGFDSWTRDELDTEMKEALRELLCLKDKE